MTYTEVRADFEFLNALVELDDCVEIDAQMFYLLEDPTKEKAAGIYEGAILLWFGEHGVLPGTQLIAEKYI